MSTHVQQKSMAQWNPLPPADPMTEAVIRACASMPHSKLVTTIPMGELIAFAHALRTHGVGQPDGAQR